MGKRSAQLFVITLAMTSAASRPVGAAQTADSMKMPPNAAIAHMQSTASVHSTALVEDSSAAMGISLQPRSWSVVLSDRMASPVRSELYGAAWVSRSRRNAHRPAGEAAESELMLHQPVAPGLFLRLSLGVDHQPRLTGASGGRAAFGLSLVRPFD